MVKNKILVIDDEKAVRNSIQLALENKGRELLFAENGQEGLHLYNEHSPVLIILDLKMPVMGGVEFFERITPISHDLCPVIILTAHGADKDIEKCFELGASAFLRKPFSFYELRGLVNHILTVKAREEELKNGRNQLEELIKKRTRELKKSEERLNNILNTLEDVVWSYSPDDGKITYISPAAKKVYGYPVADFYNNPNLWRKVLHPGDFARVESYKETLKEKGSKILEYRIIRSDGEIRWLRDRIYKQVNEKGVYVGLSGIITDITDLKKAEEQDMLRHRQLLQADKMKSLGILVAGVAHEINNPNNFIMFNAPVMSKIWEDINPILREYHRDNGEFVLGGLSYSEAGEAIPKLLLGIKEGSRRINRIVGKLKDFARQDTAGRESLVNMNEVVASAKNLLAVQIKESTKHFSADLDPDLPMTRGSFQEMEQVIINLITNSCHALRDSEKKIKISTSFEIASNSIIIKVMDEGIGVPPENLPKITDPFFTTKQELGGTGLGLSVSYNIIQDHGGFLSYTSETGQGTTATLELPIAEERP